MTEPILGIESSCDETAAAILGDRGEVLSSVIHSQIDEHAVYGGVVPEIAGRSHLRKIAAVVDAALSEAGLGPGELSAIAVTQRPGLIGSLLVGLSYAKGLAFARGLPLVPVHHIEAHVHAAGMECAHPPYPCVGLVVSGGHTALYRVDSPLEMTALATTLDDAAGEAFDKVSWMLGSGYPGGPAIAELARRGDPEAIAFPRYRPKDGTLGFSFSGLKTAVLYHLRGGDALAATPPPDEIPGRADVAASFQEAVVDSLARQCLAACEGEDLPRLLVGGGVAANGRLREVLGERCRARGIALTLAPPERCTDNAVMIAALGRELLEAGRTAGWDLDALAR